MEPRQLYPDWPKDLGAAQDPIDAIVQGFARNLAMFVESTERLGFPESEICFQAGVNPETLRAIVEGRQWPDLQTAVRFELLTKTELWELPDGSVDFSDLCTRVPNVGFSHDNRTEGAFPLDTLLEAAEECRHFFACIPDVPAAESKMAHLNVVASVENLRIHGLLKSALHRGIQAMSAANGMWFSQTPYKTGETIGLRKTPTDLASIIILLRTVEMASSKVNRVILPKDQEVFEERAMQFIKGEMSSLVNAARYTGDLTTLSGVTIPTEFREIIDRETKSRFASVRVPSQSVILREAAESFSEYLGQGDNLLPFNQDQTMYMWNLSSVIAHAQGWTSITDISEMLMGFLIGWVDVVTQHVRLATLRLLACSSDKWSPGDY